MVKEEKRFKIDLQPMRRKHSPHYSNHLLDYLDSNIRIWYDWGRLPITITDTCSNKQITILNREWYNWREKVNAFLREVEGMKKTKEEFKRFTKRVRNHVVVEDVNGANERLADIEDLMQKYQIKDVKALRNIILDYDDMAKFVVEMGLGEEVKIDEN